MDINQAVETAIQEHAEWTRKAAPSEENPQPRVSVIINGRGYSRRPFRRKGRDGQTRWVVRLQGIARLTNPHKHESGHMVFSPDWS